MYILHIVNHNKNTFYCIKKITQKILMIFSIFLITQKIQLIYKHIITLLKNNLFV